VKQAVEDAADKLSQCDKDLVLNTCNESLTWLDNNSLADKEEFEHQLKELQKTTSPVMSKLHSQGNSQSASDSHTSQSNAGPTVEEMD